MMGCPPGWAKVPLPEICTINPRVDKNTIDEETVVSFVPMPAVEAETGKIDVSETRSFGAVRKGYTPFRKGDVLFAKITPCMENGKMAIVPDLVSEYGFGSTEFHVLRPATGVDPRLLYHIVSNRAFRFHAERNMTGAVGQKRVPAIILQSHEIDLPPTNEQRRIADKIEQLFDEIDRGVQSLRDAKRTIDLYRQSLLKTAFEGRLTANWRAERPSKPKSPQVLLAYIREQRQEAYNTALHQWERPLSQRCQKGEKGRRPAKPKPLRRLPADQIEHGIPGWATVPLGLAVVDPIYGTSKKCGYGAGATGVLRIPNIKTGHIDTTDLKSADFDETEVDRFSLQGGDVLTVRSNGSLSIVGKPAMVQQQHTDYLFAGYLIRLRPIAQSLIPKYLVYLLMEPKVRAQIETKAKSTSGVNNISARELQELNVPICSPEEQAEIVRILDTSLEATEIVDAEIEANLARAEALRQSILKKAFSGQLVPQDPNDEPAATLLRRMRADDAPHKRKRGITEESGATGGLVRRALREAARNVDV